MNSEDYDKIINYILKDKSTGRKDKEEQKLSKKCKKFCIVYNTHDNIPKLKCFKRKYHLLPKKVWKYVVQE